MKFGILYNTDYHAAVHGAPDHYYGQLLEQIEIEEELGFDSVWFGEHHYSAYSFGAPALMATAAAGRTKRIRLGTGVSLLPIHHPIRLAEEYATLDVLSGGRLEYGVGRGFLRYALDVFGVDEDESHDRYHEAAELIQRAWTAQGPFSFQGNFWSLDDYEFFPPPLQKPHPPIYASAVLTPESYVWTARMGFHLATACFVPNRGGIRDGIALYRKTLEECGTDPATREVAGVYQMFCGESDAEAHRIAGGRVIDYLNFFGSIDQRRAQPPRLRGLRAPPGRHARALRRHHLGGSGRAAAGLDRLARDAGEPHCGGARLLRDRLPDPGSGAGWSRP